ncbi:MAG: hypothetical protein HFJ47_00995 [Clostridia bacterium]|nr:hypothetical protein [Clostridia bacterium]
MNGIGDARLAKNLGFLQEIMEITKSVILAVKEQGRVIIGEEDRRMFSKETVEKYTQKAGDRQNNEEMEIG